jgi:hypothetical protein
MPGNKTVILSTPGQAAVGNSIKVTEKDLGKLTNGGIGNAKTWGGLPITGLEQPNTYYVKGQGWRTEYPRNVDTANYLGTYIQGRQIGRDSYGTMVTREIVEGKQAVAPQQRYIRQSLQIEKTKEGKQDLVDEANKPVQATAEDILKRRLALIRMKGRASMPASQGATKDEPTVNISSGGAIGLNFA